MRFPQASNHKQRWQHSLRPSDHSFAAARTHRQVRPTKILIPLFLLLLAPLVLAAPNFQVEVTRVQGETGYFSTPMAGRDATITLKVSNTGDAGEMRVETGIYPRSVVEDWYNTKLLSISAEDYSVPNCPGSSSNVQTAAVTLQSGEVKTFTYTVKAPLDYTREYVVHSAAYLRCYADSPGNTGQTDYAVKAVTVRKSMDTVIAQTCTDGIRNQDETDTDCGGTKCSACRNYYECRFDKDCLSGSFCVDNGATGENICVPQQSALPNTGAPLPSVSTTTPTRNDDALTDGSTAPDDTPRQAITSGTEVVKTGNLSKWTTIPWIANGRRTFGNGEPIKVTAVFEAATEGDYLLEAGMGSVGSLLSVASITGNECDPGETEFSNKQVHLTAGKHEVTFEIGTRPDGVYSFWVAHVAECGGTVLHQVKGKGLIQVGKAGDGIQDKNPEQDNGFLLIVGSIVLLIIGGYLYTRRARR